MNINNLLKNIFFINFVPPLIVHIVCLFCWIFFSSLAATLIETFFNIALIPIYLIVVNIINCVKTKSKFFLFNLLLMELSVVLGSFFHYFNWGIATGYLFSPDSKTLALLKEFFKIGSIAIIAAGVIIQFMLVFKNEKLSNWVDELEAIYKK